MEHSNKIIGLITAILLLFSSVVLADNKLGIEPFSIKAGETRDLVICLDNDKAITAVLFDMILPQGLMIPVDADDEFQIAIAGRTTTKKHSLDANAIEGGYRFLLASMQNSVFSGTEGALITITLVANSDFAGGKITLRDIELVSPDETAVYPDTVSLVVSLEPSAVISTLRKTNHNEVYNLLGRKTSGNHHSQKGLNIIDGCKVIK